jgi:hypothetical protein
MSSLRPGGRMTSNADIEMRWVAPWNDRYDRLGDRRDAPCLLPDGRVVDVEGCKAWLQDTVYAGRLVAVADGWVDGRRGIIASAHDEDP